MKTPAPRTTGYAVTHSSAAHSRSPGNRTVSVATTHALSEQGYPFAPRPYSLDEYSAHCQKPGTELRQLAGEGHLVAFAALVGRPDFDSVHLGYWLVATRSLHPMRDDLRLLIGGLTMAAGSEPSWTPAVAHALRMFATVNSFVGGSSLRAHLVLSPLVTLAARSAFAVNELGMIIDELSMHHVSDTIIPHLPALAAIANGKTDVQNDTPPGWNVTVDDKRRALRTHLLRLADRYEYMTKPIADALGISPDAVKAAYRKMLGIPPNPIQRLGRWFASLWAK